jgi:acyl carrier protein
MSDQEHVPSKYWDPEEALNQVRMALVRIDRRLANRGIHSSSSLVDDLGFDSMRFVDLAVTLEDCFHIRELPLQEWYDAESTNDAARFTVGSLVALCTSLANSRAPLEDG